MSLVNDLIHPHQVLVQTHDRHQENYPHQNQDQYNYK